MFTSILNSLNSLNSYIDMYVIKVCLLIFTDITDIYRHY